MKCMFGRALVFLDLLFLCCVVSSISGEVISDKSILLEFKSSVSDPSGIISSWDPNSPDHCSWYGVSCDLNSRVSALNISGGGNGYTGNSEAFSCSVRSLFPYHAFGIRRICSHSDRNLIGNLSPVIAKLSELRVLVLPCNALNGEIPVAIWSLKKLEVLDLEGNFLNGELPNHFTGLRRLRVLNLGFNSIYGEIPISLSQCMVLKSLNLAGNQVKGTVPGFLGSLSELQRIYLSQNRLTGSFPDEFGLRYSCKNLQHIDLSGNSLVGQIPGSLGNCQKLQTLLLFSNKLNGFIHRELGRLQNLEVLDLSRNSLSGPIPSELGRCIKLSVLVLSSLSDECNHFEGSIPEEITTLPNLRIFWAPIANLEGKLPSRWGDCENLEMLNLAQNHFREEIVGVFNRCKKLRHLDLSSNKITGELDEELHVPCLTVFDISGNIMSGSIPSFNYSMSPCRSVMKPDHPSFSYSSFFTCKTRITSGLPFTNDSVSVIHNFGGNNFTGHIQSLPIAPEMLERHTEYAYLASGNRLDGSFPGSLFGKCDKLVGMFVNVSYNELSGHIPMQIGQNCRSLRLLDVSNNQISGFLPPNLGDLKLLVVLDWSGNKIQRITNGKPRNLQASSSETVSNSQDNGLNSIEIASIVSASTILLVLLALIIFFFYTRKWVPQSRVQVSESREIMLFTDIGVPLTYESIVQSTGNFSAGNCIGHGGFGSTYKAEISQATLVAVKRLSIGRFQGVQHFHAEIKTLEMVRHPNLVTLIGYHASESEMFLIYNYLPGGNLENFIKERSNRVVDWKILHKIALDIAHALSYLHDECDPRVLHRDVKPSNILLSNDLKAYLSDFGLSRLLGTSETHATTDVEGTFGYVAPEYATTCRLSEKADVYSYGVVLLELISDKKALDPSFSSQGHGFTIVSWARMLLSRGRSKEVFTVGLWDVGPHDDLVEMLYLAIKCTDETLSIRPTMRQVVQRLKRIWPS